MSVRKRAWTTANGEKKEAWVVDYVDQAGKRRLKTFQRKKEADAWRSTAGAQIADGVHTPDSVSVTVEQATSLWLEGSIARGLERSTTDAYKQHVDLHILPFLGRVRLSQLSAPMVREFEDRLRRGDPTSSEAAGQARSPAMIRKILCSLGSLVGDAQERGLISRNVVRDLRSRRKRGNDRRADLRQKGRLKIGVDIPSRQEIKAIIDALAGRWRPILITAIFTGLRAWELRGLRWADVDLDKRELHVRQRIDRFGDVGPPKSVSGERTVPLPPIVVSTLREWKIACPKGKLDLVFPTPGGAPEHHKNIVRFGLTPAQVAAGVVVSVIDGEGTAILKDGAPAVRAKYSGLHSLRHFFASWCINRREDGGLGLTAKMVQERMGHSNIAITMDTYSHLFPRGDDADELAEAERNLLA